MIAYILLVLEIKVDLMEIWHFALDIEPTLNTFCAVLLIEACYAISSMKKEDSINKYMSKAGSRQLNLC